MIGVILSYIHKIVARFCCTLLCLLLPFFIMTSSNGKNVTVPLWGPPVDSPYNGTVTETFEVSLMSAWTEYWTNTRLMDYSRRYDGHLTSPSGNVISKPYYLYTIEQWALRTWVWCSYGTKLQQNTKKRPAVWMLSSQISILICLNDDFLSIRSQAIMIN